MKQQKINEQNIRLFWDILKISATTFGGGFVIVPLLKNKFVDEKNIIEENEMLELMAIAQSCPGPIAVNASVMVGYRILGIKGALTALLATVIPPLVIISIISVFYELFKDNIFMKIIMTGMLCGVSAVIIDVVVKMIKKLDQNILSIAVLFISFILAAVFKINVIVIIVTAILIGIFTKGLKVK